MSSNDDRSKSLNREHPAFWASLNNHRNQVGDYDDFDEEACGPAYVPSRVPVAQPARKPEPGDAEMPITFVIPERETMSKSQVEMLHRLADMLSRL